MLVADSYATFFDFDRSDSIVPFERCGFLFGAQGMCFVGCMKHGEITFMGSALEGMRFRRPKAD